MAAVRAIGLSGQMHGAVLIDAQRHGAAPRDPVERRPQRRAVRGARGGAADAALPSPATSRCQASPHPSCCGCASTSRICSRERPACCCPRTGCACSSPASASATCPTPRARCGSTSARATGRTKCSPPAASPATTCRDWSKAARCRANCGPRWPTAGACAPASWSPAVAATTRPVRWASGPCSPNQGFVSLGTSGVIFLAGDRFRPDPRSAVHTFCHALPGRWHRMSVMLSAASALRWARDAARLAERSRAARQRSALTPAQRAACAAVPALPERRAHAAQRSQRPGRAVRADARARRGGDRLRGGRRRELRSGRRLDQSAARAKSGGGAVAGRRRRTQRPVGAVAGVGARVDAARARGRRGRCRPRRRTTGVARRWRRRERCLPCGRGRARIQGRWRRGRAAGAAPAAFSRAVSGAA